MAFETEGSAAVQLHQQAKQVENRVIVFISDGLIQ